MTNIILNQVYLSWALYQSAVEDYLLNMSVASTSEDIAEDITGREGANKAISHLESAKLLLTKPMRSCHTLMYKKLSANYMPASAWMPFRPIC